MDDLPQLRAVVFQDESWWVAMFLEYYLAAVAPSLEKLPYEVERILTAQVRVSAEHGVEPFAHFKPVPRRFWRMYEQGRPLTSAGNTELRIFEGDRAASAPGGSPSAPDSRPEP